MGWTDWCKQKGSELGSVAGGAIGSTVLGIAGATAAVVALPAALPAAAIIGGAAVAGSAASMVGGVAGSILGGHTGAVTGFATGTILDEATKTTTEDAENTAKAFANSTKEMTETPKKPVVFAPVVKETLTKPVVIAPVKKETLKKPVAVAKSVTKETLGKLDGCLAKPLTDDSLRNSVVEAVAAVDLDAFSSREPLQHALQQATSERLPAILERELGAQLKTVEANAAEIYRREFGVAVAARIESALQLPISAADMIFFVKQLQHPTTDGVVDEARINRTAVKDNFISHVASHLDVSGIKALVKKKVGVVLHAAESACLDAFVSLREDRMVLWYDPRIESAENQGHVLTMKNAGVDVVGKTDVDQAYQYVRAHPFTRFTILSCGGGLSGNDGELLLLKLSSKDRLQRNVTPVTIFCHNMQLHERWICNLKKYISIATAEPSEAIKRIIDDHGQIPRDIPVMSCFSADDLKAKAIEGQLFLDDVGANGQQVLANVTNSDMANFCTGTCAREGLNNAFSDPSIFASKLCELWSDEAGFYRPLVGALLRGGSDLQQLRAVKLAWHFSRALRGYAEKIATVGEVAFPAQRNGEYWLFRGINMESKSAKHFFDRARPDEHVLFQTPMATSVDEEIAKGFSVRGSGQPVILRIMCPKHAVEVRQNAARTVPTDISGVSVFSTEREIVCGPGTTLKILKVEKNDAYVVTCEYLHVTEKIDNSGPLFMMAFLNPMPVLTA